MKMKKSKDKWEAKSNDQHCHRVRATRENAASRKKTANTWLSLDSVARKSVPVRPIFCIVGRILYLPSLLSIPRLLIRYSCTL